MPSFTIIMRRDCAEHTHWLTLVDPACRVVLLEVQDVHEPSPVEDLNVPMRHCRHKAPSEEVMPGLHTQRSPTWTLLGSDTHTHSSTSVAPRAVVVVPSGHAAQLEASVAAPYWPRPQASHPSADARLRWPEGQMHFGFAPEGSMPDTQTHWLTLDAPVVFVVRPSAHATHVLSLVSDW